MPKFFIKQEQLINDKIYINGTDVNHIKKVLRSKIGDELEICSIEQEKNFLCQIENIKESEIACKIIKTVEDNVEPHTKVTIFQGLPKAEKMEFIIQKAVELGVYDITPVEMKRCIVKLNEKDKIKKIDRWQKISEGAAKQSGRNIIPKVNNVICIKEICNIIEKYDIVLVAYEKEQQNTIKNMLKKIKESQFNKIGIVIGPEGGIEEEEIQQLKKHNAQIITLGARILRTETVALNILSNIMYELED